MFKLLLFKLRLRNLSISLRQKVRMIRNLEFSSRLKHPVDSEVKSFSCQDFNCDCPSFLTLAEMIFHMQTSFIRWSYRPQKTFCF